MVGKQAAASCEHSSFENRLSIHILGCGSCGRVQLDDLCMMKILNSKRLLQSLAAIARNLSAKFQPFDSACQV